MKRLLLVAVFSTVACAAGLAKSGTFSAMPPSLAGINTAAPAYTREDERLVSEIAGSILNIAAFADHFEPGDSFQVRNAPASRGVNRFSLTRRAEVFTIELNDHVWRPAGYVRLARSFMADGAESTLTEDPALDPAPVNSVLDAGAIAAQNLRLSRLLAEHPRSPALHQRAALLLGVAARQQTGAERRRLLCRMTAHLAVARALHQGRLDGEGLLAERQLAALAAREMPIAASASVAGGAGPEGPATFGDIPRLQILPFASASATQR